MPEEGLPRTYDGAAPFRPAPLDPLLHRALPVAKELPSYGGHGARRDLIAGVTVAALAIPSAMGLVSFADEVLTARSFAGRHDQHIAVRSELVAMGAAYAVAGVTQGLPVGASGSRTAVNDAMGARSQIAGIVIVVACMGLVDVASWRAPWATDRVEVAIASITAVGVIVTGVLNAILFAVGLSIFDVVRRSARPHDAVHGWDEGWGAGPTCPCTGTRA